MPRNRKTKSYPSEFREKAVRLVNECGHTIDDVAAKLGCSKESVRRWKEDALRKLNPENVAQLQLEASELKRLRKRVAQLEQENDILKKATAYFAREIQ
jgi:transposase